MTQLVQYEAMRAAIRQCARIDEAAQIRDKAIAFAAYARQRDDKQAEAWFAEIKARACLRIGELSLALPTQQGKLCPSRVTKRQAWKDARLSPATANRYEQLARAVQKGTKPTRLKDVYAVIKQQRRNEREQALAEATEAASTTLGVTLYPVIYADPPWRFEPYSRETGMDRAADNHYPTMTIEELRELKIPAADDAALFLWATVPMLLQAHDVMEAWGFTYRSHFVWLKDRIGTGYWVRNQHELLLIGTKGRVPAPAPGEQHASVIEAKVGNHSAKPAAFAEIIEEMFPNCARLEMFARAPRLGWDAWGNEVGEHDGDRLAV
jgi:N6-adenosine-specific RNA methylase IME4